MLRGLLALEIQFQLVERVHNFNSKPYTRYESESSFPRFIAADIFQGEGKNIGKVTTIK